MIWFIRKFDSLRKKITHLEMENKHLRCCGNCDHYYYLEFDSYCLLTGNQVNGYLICDKWKSDNMSQEERNRGQ